ncbi:MAG: carbohydrate binding family 9 domain-containing protein [Gemmatimonadetes bacterium]|nr:carbohydrate binding family 9 domain-containing protein [Gemmatimonadota bacterium]
MTTGPDGRMTVRAFRVEGRIDVDGRLDEGHYTAERMFDQLVQAVPVAGADPSERTEIWIAFDDANLYVAARVWYAGGESRWIANEMRRDSQQLRANDSFGLYFDTYHDRRNAIGFFANPIGGFAEVQITNEGSPNFDWNAVWDIRTGRFDGGWTIEMGIPFKSLRYRPGVEQVWGVQIRRSVLADNEWNYLTPIPIQFAGGGPNGVFRVSLYADLVGIEAPPVGRNLDVKPFGTSGLRTDHTVATPVDNDVDADVGLDVKYAITQNLTADFTYNTDFAQVEVDEQQVNLTRFGLSFPEKRDFFLESQGIFNFATGGFGFSGPGGGGGDTPRMFYSRRMGLQGSTPVPILGGVRLTGKVGAFDVGALTMQTREEQSIGAESTNFSVLRLRRDILARSSVGLLLQNRSNSIVAGRGSNQAWGFDGTFGLTSDLSFISYYARSETPGLTGKQDSYRAQLSHDADLFGGSIDYLAVGDDFNPEVGFVRRSGFEVTSGNLRFSPRPAAIRWIRQLIFQTDGSYLTEQETGLVESRSYGGRFQVDLARGDAFTTQYSNSYENLVAPARISGAPFAPGRYEWDEYQVSYRFGPQRPYQGNLSVRWGGFYTGDRFAIGVNQGRIEVTPQLSMEPSLEFNWLELPQQTTPGEFNQHVARLRTTYTLTPRAYVSGLVQYASGTNTVSGNFRLRWEWAPGSEFFLVYTEDRNTDLLGSDRWSDLSNRGLVIKVTRLFRP